MGEKQERNGKPKIVGRIIMMIFGALVLLLPTIWSRIPPSNPEGSRVTETPGASASESTEDMNQANDMISDSIETPQPDSENMPEPILTEPPTPAPTDTPTPVPTDTPTPVPTDTPTPVPTDTPTPAPTDTPTPVPTDTPTPAPTDTPTPAPTDTPTPVPTDTPTPVPTDIPTPETSQNLADQTDPYVLPAFQTKKFQAGQKIKVYSAPDQSSWRGGGGKAVANSNSAINVAGKSDRWLLISYQSEKGNTRVGYIEIEQIKGDIPEAPILQFAHTAAMISSDVKMTDDPYRESQTITTLKAGAEVTYLASYDNYAYIETNVGKKTARGFVHRNAIVIQKGREIPIAFATASGEIRGYPPQQLLDGRKDTSWQIRLPSAKPSGVYLELQLATPCDIQMLAIWNGFWRVTNNLDQYIRNARIKTMKLSFVMEGEDDYSFSREITLPETKDWRTRNIGCLVDLSGIGRVSRIKIEPLSIYQGKRKECKYDVCISEVKIYGFEDQ